MRSRYVNRTTPDIEIYKGVRAHEVMLNQAVSAFEGVLAEIVGATRTEEEDKRLQEVRSKDPEQTTRKEATEATRSPREKAAEDRDLRAAYGVDAGKEHLRLTGHRGLAWFCSWSDVCLS